MMHLGSISIHAPVKGATPNVRMFMIFPQISIHAPVKGATLLWLSLSPAAAISIHAPVKGATAKITKTIPNDFCKINNYNNSFA